MRVLRQALKQIVTGDATMRTLCGRSSDLIRPWRTLATAKLPVVTFTFADQAQTGESGEKWETITRLSCWADQQTGGDATIEDMAKRLLAILNYPAFAGLASPPGPLEATIVRLRKLRDVEAMVGDAPIAQGRVRKDVELVIRLTLS